MMSRSRHQGFSSVRGWVAAFGCGRTASIPHPTSPIRHGFTLVEMLVVISIIGLVVGLTFPFISKMTEIAEGGGGQSSISVATNAARILNHRLAKGDKGGTPGAPVNADYSGTIALFSSAGEIRFCINDQTAADATNTFLENNVNVNGYEDIDGLDYLTLPREARIAGVTRVSGTTTYLAPPFAIRFDEFGHIASDQRYVYYDSDFDGDYDTGDTRDGSYNPDSWDPRTGASVTVDSNTLKYEMDFERIDTVSAVVLYNASDFRGAGLVWGTSTNAAIGTWLKANGTPVFFNPHTGLMLKE